MKKLLLITLLASFALTSCTNDNAEQDVPFSKFKNIGTVGLALTGDMKFENEEECGHFAIYTNSDAGLMLIMDQIPSKTWSDSLVSNLEWQREEFLRYSLGEICYQALVGETMHMNDQVPDFERIIKAMRGLGVKTFNMEVWKDEQSTKFIMNT